MVFLLTEEAHLLAIDYLLFEGFCSGYHYCRRSAVERHEYLKRKAVLEAYEEGQARSMASSPSTPKKRRIGDPQEGDQEPE